MKILYVKSRDSTFIRLDQEILEKNFTVYSFQICSTGRIQYLLSLIRLFFFLSVRLHSADIVFTRFADWHTTLLTFFCSIYKKKLIIVVGGYDVANMPEYDYGAFSTKFRGWCVRYSLRNADYLLPNNPFLVEYSNGYAFSEPRKGGIRHFVPDLKGIVKVIHNGYKTDFWTYDQSRQKENIAITVAYVRDYRFFRLKGIDDFIEVARMMPDYEFVIIGMSVTKSKELKISVPDNLILIPEVDQKELREFYQRAKVFCLFSVTEGMPNVLCEAMLCNCIPVCSDVTFMPEIVGDAGFINKRKNINELKENVQKAFKSGEDMGIKARRRIVEHFSIQRREKELFDLINSLPDNEKRT
jgi:glycosyltransferase involved in cell wall biosynthesis